MMEGIIIKIVNIPTNLSIEDALPRYTDLGDSGMDLKALGILVPMENGEDLDVDVPFRGYTIKPMHMGGCPVTIRTGVCVEMEVGMEAQVRPRSGLSKKGVVAMLGTVDAGYIGEICVTVINLGRKPFTLYPGDRIAQLVFAEVLTPRLSASIAIPVEHNEYCEEYRMGGTICDALNNPKLTIKSTERTELAATNRGTKGFGSSGI